MICRDLEADFLVALRNDWEIEARRQDTVTPEVGHQGRRAGRVANHQRHDWMLSWNGLESEIEEALLESGCHCPEMS